MSFTDSGIKGAGGVGGIEGSDNGGTSVWMGIGGVFGIGGTSSLAGNPIAPSTGGAIGFAGFGRCNLL